MKVGITSDKWPSTVVHEADGKVQIELREGDGIAIIEIALGGPVDDPKRSMPVPRWEITYLYRNGAAVDCGDWPTVQDIDGGCLDRCPRCARVEGHAEGCPIGRGNAQRGPGGLRRIQ